jgi:hypothetical protein
MSKILVDRKVLEQALEALEMSRRFVYADNRPQCDDAITDLRVELDQPEQEPVDAEAALKEKNHE